MMGIVAKADELLALTPERAAAVAEISKSQLRYGNALTSSCRRSYIDSAITK
jgi:hypothetical protein